MEIYSRVKKLDFEFTPALAAYDLINLSWLIATCSLNEQDHQAVRARRVGISPGDALAWN
jgi:hypothetical protein